MTKQHLRLLGFIEGSSLLALLLIAMPLKYIYGMPQFVRVTGTVHGALFLAYIYAAFTVGLGLKWPFKRIVLAWVAATIPFGPFLLDKKLFNKP